MMTTESLTNREWLPGELFSGLEHRRPSWFLDMKYQTCFDIAAVNCIQYLGKVPPFLKPMA